MKVIAIFALFLISTTLGAAVTTEQLTCIAGCKASGAVAAAKSVTDLAKYTADGIKEAAILAAKTCTYPTGVDDVSVYCAFGACYEKAYTVTSTAAKNELACETKCVGGCASSA